jgi:hypothetical protein
MSTPHWKPRNVTLTGNSALHKPQSLGGEFVPAGTKNWFTDEGFEISRQALIRMQANGWQGYGAKPKRKRKPTALTTAQVKAWMAANRSLAATMLMDLAA